MITSKKSPIACLPVPTGSHSLELSPGMKVFNKCPTDCYVQESCKTTETGLPISFSTVHCPTFPPSPGQGCAASRWDPQTFCKEVLSYLDPRPVCRPQAPETLHAPGSALSFFHVLTGGQVLSLLCTHISRYPGTGTLAQ